MDCGKPGPNDSVFCVHCGKGAKAAPSQPAPFSQPSMPIVSQEVRPVPQSSGRSARSSHPAAKRKVALVASFSSIGALLVLGLVAGLVWTLGNNPVLSAFRVGLENNCDALPANTDVRFSESEVDSNGQKAIEVIASGNQLLWHYRDLGSGGFRFEIDSIYGPSAVRAQALGCKLTFSEN